jgi:hypothetical protein
MTHITSAVAALAALTLTAIAALASCSNDGSASSDSSPAANPDSSTPNGDSSVFDPDEPTLPGGVRVLSQDVDGFVQVPAGRHAVRVSESLLYQFDLPEHSEVFGGVYLNPGKEAGGDTIIYLFPADDRMALPLNPCRDHTLKVAGPTVDDLAGALSRQPYLHVTTPADVTVGGADGLFVKATVPDDAEAAACQDGQLVMISDKQGNIDVDPGMIDRMWILDIDGARHVLLARTFGDTRLDTRLVNRLVQSVTFTHG